MTSSASVRPRARQRWCEDPIQRLQLQIIAKIKAGEIPKALYTALEVEEAKEPDLSQLSGDEILSVFMPLKSKKLGEFNSADLEDWIKILERRSANYALMNELKMDAVRTGKRLLLT